MQGLEAGADAYLLKPFNTDELHVRIAKLLEQRRVLRDKYSHALRNNCPESVKLLPADQAFMDRLTDIVYSQISDTALNSDKIAEKMCMSKSQLNRKVRVITGSNTTICRSGTLPCSAGSKMPVISAAYSSRRSA